MAWSRFSTCAFAALLAMMLLSGPLGSAHAETASKTQKATATKKPSAAVTKKKPTAKPAVKKKKAAKTPAKHSRHHHPAPKRHLAVVTSTLLTRADIAALTDAFAEADRRNWTAARSHALRLSDPVAAKLILWARLVAQDSGSTLAEIIAFQEKNPDWPRQALLTRRAEEALLAYPMSNQDMIAWFTTHPPQTGEGKIRFGQALIGTGQTETGKDWIQRGWVEDDFSPVRQKEILANFRSYLTLSVQKARLNRLLWDNRTSDARMTAALIGEDAAAFADARIRLTAGSTVADSALQRVPRSYRNDPGLLFDRIRYERRRGNDSATVPLVLTAPAEPHQMVNPDAWWIERKIAARIALNQGQYKDAYEIVSRHGLKGGADFAEAEFMSGWIALQYVNNPGEALVHFLKLNEAVSTPISKARAEYWCARAASAQGDKRVAELYYRRAALYPTTYYGQLGAAALTSFGSEARLHLPKDPSLSAADRANFRRLELVHAVEILHDLHRDDQMWSFMLHLADILETPKEIAELSDLALTFDNPKLALRVAKTAAQRNVILTARAYPVSRMPAYRVKGPPVEKALVYGLSRQESEFDSGATSPAGARGLMQLMPATARRVAHQIDVPYSPARLTDPAYNAMLGSAHLGDLIDGYSGSYVMSIAAYNAGGSRVADWIGRFGDPRSTAIDPVDWVESIPFSETRNYVQRVMENLEIYRSRLSGKSEPIRLADDLRRNTGAPIVTLLPATGKLPLASTLASTSAPVPASAPAGSLAEAADTKPAIAVPPPPEKPALPLPRVNGKR